MKKNIFDKLNKFRLVHQKLIMLITILFKLAMAIAVLYLLMMITGDKIQQILSNPEIVVILASVLGAVVGGTITYYINKKSMLQSNYMKTSTINKKVIYEPLIMEYKDILGQLLGNHTLHFSYDPNYRTIGSTQFEVWQRIKNDTRYYQIPDYYKKECLLVEENIKRYSKAITNIAEETYITLNTLLEDKGYRIEENASGIKSFINIDNLLNGKNVVQDILLRDKIRGMPDVNEKDKELIIKEFQLKVTELNTVILFKESKSELISSVEQVIATTEKIIIRIATTYEKKNNIF